MSTKQDCDNLVNFIDDCEKLFDDILAGKLSNSPLKNEYKDARKEVNHCFSETKSGITNIPIRLLAGVGLLGDQLKLKLKGFYEALKAWLQNSGKDLLITLLKWANIILGSLSSVLQVCEPIKEFKDCMEAGIDVAID